MRDFFRHIYYKNLFIKNVIFILIMFVLAFVLWKMDMLGYFPPLLLIVVASLRLTELVYLKDDVMSYENKSEKAIKREKVFCLIGYIVSIVAIIKVINKGYV